MPTAARERTSGSTRLRSTDHNRRLAAYGLQAQTRAGLPREAALVRGDLRREPVPRPGVASVTVLVGLLADGALLIEGEADAARCRGAQVLLRANPGLGVDAPQRASASAVAHDHSAPCMRAKTSASRFRQHSLE